MIRSFTVALVTIVAVSLSGPVGRIAAQSRNAATTQSVPMDFTGGTPGVNVELFLNSGKVADVPLDAQGAGTSILDLGNLGKVHLQVYVDVCQDGKLVKVLVADGQPAPEDQGCKRRIAGGAWWSDCGVTRITLDLTKFGTRVIGCGSLYTQPKFYGPVGGALVVGGLLLGGGGGDSDSTFVTAPITLPSVTTSTNTTAANPPVVTTPTMPPMQPIDFGITFSGTAWDHAIGVSGQSDACGLFLTSPAQANVPFTITTTGPGVVQSTVTGTTTSSGMGRFRVRINLFGSYTFTVNVTSSGVAKTGTGTVNVTSANNTCP